MPRIDDYKEAVELGKKELKDKNPKRIAILSGADFRADAKGNVDLSLKFLNKEVVISWPELDFSFKGSGEELPIQQQVILLHYLNGSKGLQVAGDWISYQEIPDGRFYLDAFLRRAKNPMVKAFGSQPDLMIRLAISAYGARPFDYGDVSIVLQALPMVPVALILWRGDEEFSPEGNILFDRTISNIFSAEDIAWLAGMTIYPLLGMISEKG